MIDDTERLKTTYASEPRPNVRAEMRGDTRGDGRMDTPAKAIPSSIEAERAVLGSLLIDPDAVIKIASFLRPKDFYRERHVWLYEALLGLNERHEPLEFVTVVDELERRGHL